MQHTIAAVFDRQDQAEQAIDDLVASGFSRDAVRLSHTEGGAGEGARDSRSFGANIKSFFHDIFGTVSRDDAELYSEAVLHGHYVLTVDVADDMVERATEVFGRHDPIDINEQAEKWKSGGWVAAEPARQQGAAQAQQSAAAQQQSQAGGTAIPVIEEALKVGKRAVQRGGVRVFRRVVETPVQERVNLSEEHVKVERHRVDQPASAADLAAFQEGSFEVRETAEEPVVEKVVRVVEEVVVGKEVTQHEQQISDTLRRTEVEVEQLGRAPADDETEFRRHWSGAYAGAGGSYDDYAPAYRYGSALAGSERYKGRRWDDIEADARSGWEAGHAGSAWDKIKNAVRHGWEGITS